VFLETFSYHIGEKKLADQLRNAGTFSDYVAAIVFDFPHQVLTPCIYLGRRSVSSRKKSFFYFLPFLFPFCNVSCDFRPFLTMLSRLLSSPWGSSFCNLHSSQDKALLNRDSVLLLALISPPMVLVLTHVLRLPPKVSGMVFCFQSRSRGPKRRRLELPKSSPVTPDRPPDHWMWWNPPWAYAPPNLFPPSCV